MEFLRQRAVIATPYTSKSYQHKTKGHCSKRMHTGNSYPIQQRQSLPAKKISVESRPHPQPNPRTWLEAMTAKKLKVAAYREVHTNQAHVYRSSKSSFIPDQDYCAVCTLIDRKSPNEFHGCQYWEDNKEEENNQHKVGDDFSECSEWDADLEEQDRQKQELENRHVNEGKKPLGITKSLPKALTFQLPKSTGKWLKWEFTGNKHKTLTAEPEYTSSKSLEDVK